MQDGEEKIQVNGIEVWGALVYGGKRKECAWVASRFRLVLRL